MRKKFVFIAVILVIATFAGCKKKEEQPVPKTSAPHALAQKNIPSPHGNIQKGERKVVVPDAVKSQWKKVRFIIEDKIAKKNTEYDVQIGSEFKLPGTALKIVVGEFIPDFKIIDNETVITSASNEPKNPAVKVEVFENSKSIFKGWLYSKFPDIHPLVHEKYGLYLKEGIKG
ncbi:MAG: DUF2155 domain-containing protein [Thermodesulfovibrionales bacterium]|nr:DUF2155 domain-containing protein [Thermodesulfovibrionales bacterium]